MAKTNVSELSTAKITIEAQPGQAVAASTLGATTISALTLGSGNAVSAAASVASTNKVAISVNGTTYYFLVTTVA